MTFIKQFTKLWKCNAIKMALMFKKMCHQTLNTCTFVALNTVKALNFAWDYFANERIP